MYPYPACHHRDDGQNCRSCGSLLAAPSGSDPAALPGDGSHHGLAERTLMMPVVHDDSDAASPSAPQPRSRRTVWYAAAALTATAGVLLTATVVLARRPSATPAIAATLAGGNDTAKATPSTSTSTSTSDKTSS